VSATEVPESLIAANPALGPWAVLVGYRGSVAHGTYVPNTDPASIDDVDLMALCVPDESHYFGLEEFGSRGTEEIVVDPWDIVAYEVRKAVSLLLKGNPNVLSMLWLPEDLYTQRTPAGDLLIDNRDAFVGSHVYDAYVGYAMSQLRQMERVDHDGYMGPKRRSLVERFGYDCKNASHLIRLLRQCIEFLDTGELQVRRADAAELVAIKLGEWPLDRVKDEANRLFRLAEETHEHSALPPSPDTEKAGALCVEVVRTALADRAVEASPS
jgi:uncharacterized protein